MDRRHASIVRPPGRGGTKDDLRTWYTDKELKFRAVRLKLIDTSCRVCRSLRDAEFYIFNLLRKDHPLYRVTHPNCQCLFEPIPESSVLHDEFDNNIGYKVKQRKVDDMPVSEPKPSDRPTKPEAKPQAEPPAKPETPPPEKKDKPPEEPEPADKDEIEEELPEEKETDEVEEDEEVEEE